MFQKKKRKFLKLSNKSSFDEIKNQVVRVLNTTLNNEIKKHRDLLNQDNPTGYQKTSTIQDMVNELNEANSIDDLLTTITSINNFCTDEQKTIDPKAKKVFSPTRGTELLKSMLLKGTNLKFQLLAYKHTQVMSAGIYTAFVRSTGGASSTLKDWKRCGNDAYIVNGESVTHPPENIDDLEQFLTDKGITNEIMRNYILENANQDGLWAISHIFAGRILDKTNDELLLVHPDFTVYFTDLQTITLHQLHTMINQSESLEDIANTLGLTEDELSGLLLSAHGITYDQLKELSENDALNNFEQHYEEIAFPGMESNLHLKYIHRAEIKDMDSQELLCPVTFEIDMMIKENGFEAQVYTFDLKISDETLQSLHHDIKNTTGSQEVRVALLKVENVIQDMVENFAELSKEREKLDKLSNYSPQ